MSTPNQLKAKSTQIGDHLQKRPHKRHVARRVGEVRRRLHRMRRRYGGGLRAEQDSRRQLVDEAKQEARGLILGRRGRRIHLELLLRQRREDGNPRWTLVDPTRPVCFVNGGYDSDGDVRVGGTSIIQSKTIGLRQKAFWHKQHGGNARYPDGGFPALPGRVRRLASDPAIRKRAEWVAILYQPHEWRQVDPDPALVVKWKGVDGYYALAVWGGDRARLMEFVD